MERKDLIKINSINGELSIKDDINHENSDTNVEKRNKVMEDVTSEKSICLHFNQFRSLMSSIIGDTNYELFEYLLTTFHEKLSTDLWRYRYKYHYKYNESECVKLKENMKNTLNFFHFYWRDVKERVGDSYSYLNKMTEIIKIYIDLEMMTYCKIRDSPEQISSIILSAIYLYLDNSEEHRLRVLLESISVTKAFNKIFSPIFAKCLSDIHYSIDIAVVYVRYLITFKLWRAILDTEEEKTKITNMAIVKLGRSVPNMNSELLKFIPEPSENVENGTLWLMESETFDLQRARDGFRNLEHKMHSFSLNEHFEEEKLRVNSSSQTNPKIDQSTKKKFIPRRMKLWMKKTKPAQVLFVDLTSEEEEGNKKVEKKRQRTRKKFNWLEDIIKIQKSKKPEPSHKLDKWLEVTNNESIDIDKNSDNSQLKNTELCQLFLDENTDHNLINSNQISLDDKNSNELKYSWQDIANSNATYVTSLCDKLRHNEFRDIFDFASDDISLGCGEKLTSELDYLNSDITEVCPVPTRVGDHFSESSSGIWTDYNSADSECETLQEDVFEDLRLKVTPMDYEFLPVENNRDLLFSQVVNRTSPMDLQKILNGKIDVKEYQDFFESAILFSDGHVSDILKEDRLLDNTCENSVIPELKSNEKTEEQLDIEVIKMENKRKRGRVTMSSSRKITEKNLFGRRRKNRYVTSQAN